MKFISDHVGPLLNPFDVFIAHRLKTLEKDSKGLALTTPMTLNSSLFFPRLNLLQARCSLLPKKQVVPSLYPHLTLTFILDIG
jgi:hypothetical protein